MCVGARGWFDLGVFMAAKIVQILNVHLADYDVVTFPDGYLNSLYLAGAVWSWVLLQV